MRFFFITLSVLITFLLFQLIIACSGQQSLLEERSYPQTKTVHDTDSYFGKAVADPYRWLEEYRNPEVNHWASLQTELTKAYLSEITYRDTLEEKLKTLWNYPRKGVPQKAGQYLFYSKNEGLRDQSRVFARKNNESKLLFDPVEAFQGEDRVSVNRFVPSDDGRHLAISISRSGSDWQEIIILDVESGERLEDHLKWIKFSSIAWHKDGFFYSRYDKPENELEGQAHEYHKVYFHKLGTSQEDDILIHEDTENPRRNFYVWTPDKGDFFILYASEGSGGYNKLWYASLKNGVEKAEKLPLITEFKARYQVIGYDNGQLYLLTNEDSPLNRVIAINPYQAEYKKEIIAELDMVMESASFAGNKIIIRCIDDVVSRLLVYSRKGGYLYDIEMPGSGAVYRLNSKDGDEDVYFSYTSFNEPSAVYHLKQGEFKARKWFEPNVALDTDFMEIKQVFYESKDGTAIPMFIVSRKDVELDGNNPLLLYGYGGFNVSMRPHFSRENFLFIKKGGIYAVPNLRGGGEYGRQWHKAGTGLNKQNTFDDFISAAEYLIASGYTRQSKIAINGRSNGGLLVGAVMTQRPDLFRVAIPEVGLYDMLRYHQFTIGWAWADDYGTADDSIDFHNLLSYSPLHNLNKDICYPATMVMTSDHDDRVVPSHSYKFAAKLQAVQACNQPALLRVEQASGHGAGTPVSVSIRSSADRMSFIMYHLGMLNQKH